MAKRRAPRHNHESIIDCWFSSRCLLVPAAAAAQTARRVPRHRDDRAGRGEEGARPGVGGDQRRVALEGSQGSAAAQRRGDERGDGEAEGHEPRRRRDPDDRPTSCIRSSTTRTTGRRCADTSRATRSRCAWTRSRGSATSSASAVGSGATSVGGLRFDLRDRAAAEREALRLAVQDARSRADAAAAGAGVQVVRVLRIEEQRMFEPGPRPMMRQMAADSMAADAPPITPGTIEIRSTVTLTVRDDGRLDGRASRLRRASSPDLKLGPTRFDEAGSPPRPGHRRTGRPAPARRAGAA